MANFSVYLQSEVKVGYDKNIVRKDIAAALRLDKKQSMKLLKSEVILKKNIDYETAERYVKRFSAFGALCRVEDKTPLRDRTMVDNQVTNNSVHKSKNCIACNKPIHIIADRCSYCAHMQNEPLPSGEKRSYIKLIAIGFIIISLIASAAYFIVQQNNG